MTLGDLIEELSAFPREATIEYDGGEHPCEFASWRGRYAELTLVPDTNYTRKQTVGALLDQARAAVGASFEGWKGGDFVMDEVTAVYADDYGSSIGRMILGIEQNDTLDGFVIRTLMIPWEYR